MERMKTWQRRSETPGRSSKEKQTYCCITSRFTRHSEGRITSRVPSWKSNKIINGIVTSRLPHEE
jgi:hypothetical protein